MADLPTGTVTFLFTDIEGSTQLLQRLGERYAGALADHHAMLRAAFEKWNGREIDTQGDAFFVVFARASDAIGAVVDAQRALATHAWPQGVAVRVRMGLHTGEAILTESGYVGLDVHRAARIGSAGHGGQVLLSMPTHLLVRDALPEGVTLRDLGEHRLKDIIHPERLYQLVAPGLSQDFPPLKTLDVSPNNLPAQLTSFIGREREIAQIKQLLSSTRLVTLTGAPGVGKTRLAQEVARELLEGYTDGVWWVELAALKDGADPDVIPQAVANVLSICEEPGRSLTEMLLGYLQSRQLLLLLDNCEHLVEQCSVFANTFLPTCPNLRVLATSREALQVPGELDWQVPPLSLPDDRQRLPALEELGQYEAVRLFIERACLSQPQFAMTKQNAEAVTQVCRRLGGLPLAIGLAAPWVKRLSVEEIATRLADHFWLLTGGVRTALPHQQTLQAAVDWSYDLLSEAERTLFNRVSVFAGGFTLEAAEAVGARKDVKAYAVLDLLSRLVDKSLVVAEGANGLVRYRLLEPLREYGHERLVATGEEASIRRTHAEYYLALAEETEPRLRGPDQAVWQAQLEREHDNLRAALYWAQEIGEAEYSLRLAGALGRFWWLRGHLREGRQWLERALSQSGGVSASVRAKALYNAGRIAHQQGDFKTASDLLDKSLAVYRELGDRRGIARSLYYLGFVTSTQGDFGRARDLLEESVAIQRELEDKKGLADSLVSLGIVDFLQGNYAAARPYFEESLSIFKELGHKLGIANSLLELGIVTRHQGDSVKARALLEEGLTIYRELEHKAGIASSLYNLGNVAMDQGDYTAARAWFEESLVIAQELGIKSGIANLLESFASLAVAQDQAARSARLFGAAEALREFINAPLEPAERTIYDRTVAAVCAQLDESIFAQTWAEGRAMTLDRAVEYVLEKP